MNPESFLSSILGKKVLILIHIGADVDAVGSAGALYYAFRKNSSLTIGIPEHVNLNAKQMAERLEIPYEINPAVDKFDALILLDLNSFEMLGSMRKGVKKFKKPILLIDHHADSGEKFTVKELSLIDENAVSTTELLYKLFKKMKIGITPKIASCIAAGVITDSAGFLVADHSTFMIMAEVLELSGKSYSDIVSLFRIEADISEKIAQLKAAKRCRIFKCFKHLIVSTDVGAFEASAATSLVRLGADIAFAGDSNDGKILISGRANNQFLKETGFDLAKEVFMPLGTEMGGSGGGHAGAAGYNGAGDDVSPFLDKCVELAKRFLEKKHGKSSGIKEYN
ncbi:MAG: DHH family phosphoesterase [Candidatus Diapherotrites archaeon]